MRSEHECAWWEPHPEEVIEMRKVGGAMPADRYSARFRRGRGLQQGGEARVEIQSNDNYGIDADSRLLVKSSL
jgi:hypothetical protein